ncbi:hypothetical protein OAT84_00100 [Gammaproteobacteria bacterium]|nr:hypothetical protein [Gammaproteobacteria bacterium]
MIVYRGGAEGGHEVVPATGAYDRLQRGAEGEGNSYDEHGRLILNNTSL